MGFVRTGKMPYPVRTGNSEARRSRRATTSASSRRTLIVAIGEEYAPANAARVRQMLRMVTKGKSEPGGG